LFVYCVFLVFFLFYIIFVVSLHDEVVCDLCNLLLIRHLFMTFSCSVINFHPKILFIEFYFVILYLRPCLTNQNSIAEEIKSRLRSGSARYHSVQNRLYSRSLSKNLKIKIYRTIILPVVLYGFET